MSALKISHHRHSGRFREHEYTSYLPLVILLVVVGVALSLTTAYAQTPGPAAESIGLTGAMPGQAPTTAATIENPNEGQHFSTIPVNVNGTCPTNTIVQIYKNDIFAGSVVCDNSGNYSVDIDLLIGQNILIARVYDALNQAGPDSNPVTVFYDALPPQAATFAPLNFRSAQLLLNTDAVFRGSFPEQDLKVPLEIIGGTPPFAVNVQWGDSNNNVVPRNDNVSFDVVHAYSKPGVYQISFQATDTNNLRSFLAVAAIINGQPGVASAPEAQNKVNKLLVLWPLYTASIAVVLSFWLGERREKKVLIKYGLAQKPEVKSPAPPPPAAAKK